MISGITGNFEFLFEGLKFNATKLKSLEGVDIAWLEQAGDRQPGAAWIF